MGSLTSRPKVPQVQQQPVIITMPTPGPAPVVSSPAAPASPVPSDTGTPSGAPDNAGADNTSNEEAQRLAREDNLLRRSRGRLSTVLTGFSGVLSQAAPSGRKTLLGE